MLNVVTTYYIGNTFEWTGSTSTMIKYYYAGGQRVAMRKESSTLYFLLGDHLGIHRSPPAATERKWRNCATSPGARRATPPVPRRRAIRTPCGYAQGKRGQRNDAAGIDNLPGLGYDKGKYAQNLLAVKRNALAMEMDTDSLTLTIVAELPPLVMDANGVIRVGNTRVTLDTVVTAFEEGATAEEIVYQYPSLNLADVYAVPGYYLQRQAEVDTYLQRRRHQAQMVRESNEARYDPRGIRERLLARHSPHNATSGC